jgi:serine/threonine protein phosphatase PrpC
MQAVVNVQPSSGQDRAAAIPVAGGYLVVLADGAGGTGNGAAAAERLIEFVGERLANPDTRDWFAALCEFDDALASDALGGETTAIVAFVATDRLRGASVGDSSAWLVGPTGGMTDLTAAQRRKPLLGSGEALPVEFEATRFGQHVLFGSDGLFKYAPADRICAFVRGGASAEAVAALVDCVRLPSGQLHDDVAVVIVSG